MRPIDGDRLMMYLTDWWYSSFGQSETDESKAIKTVLDKIEQTIGEFALEKQDQDRWIPVTERLPKKDCLYRVTVKNEFGKYVGDCFWNKSEKQFENWNAYLDCYVKVSDVKAWKPIEEPYTEEDNDKR